MTTDQTEDPMRAFARSLFAPDETDETEPDEQKPPIPNHVAKEGNISQPKDDSDKQFVRDLFN